MELAEKRNIPVEEKDFTRYDAYSADERSLTGTAAEVIPVTKVDGRTIGSGKPGEITRTLIQDYKELTKSTGTEIFL